MSDMFCSILTSLGLACQAAAYTPSSMPSGPPVQFSVDRGSHQVIVHQGANVTQEINNALAYLAHRPDQDNRWTVTFDSGQYVITSTLIADRLQNVDLVSNPARPAILSKAPNFPNEYLFHSRFSSQISIQGFVFRGNTPNYIAANYATPKSIGWRDQGLYFGSCSGVTITGNRFFDIGDAAIRITTTEADPVAGVNSAFTRISDNYFDNIYQVTTTSNDNVHGGSANMLVQDNTFDHIWGSIKFASRTEGATNVVFRRNAINSSATDGLEIVGYDNLEISDNQIRNIARTAINCYTNLRASHSYNWGDNLIFRNNNIQHAGNGIRFSADPYPDGFRPQPSNVIFSGNTITDISGTSPALSLQKSNFPGLTLLDNQFARIASDKYINLPSKPTDLINRGNKADGNILSIF